MEEGKESVDAVLRVCTEQGKTKGFGKINRRWRGSAESVKSWSVCRWFQVFISSQHFGFIVLYVKGRLFKTNTACTLLREVSYVYEVVQKFNLIPSGDTRLWYSVSGPETGIMAQSQNIQQHQGSHERSLSYADKNENIFLGDSTVAPRGRMFI